MKLDLLTLFDNKQSNDKKLNIHTQTNNRKQEEKKNKEEKKIETVYWYE